MSLLELKLTILEDYCKKNEDRWHCEYIREHWKFESILKPLKNKELIKGKLPLIHGVSKK